LKGTKEESGFSAPELADWPGCTLEAGFLEAIALNGQIGIPIQR
jgi:hypothetical protein